MPQETTPMSLADYLVALLTDNAHREAFLGDPKGHLAEHGLSDLSGEDVTDTVEALCHQLPAEEAEKFDAYLSESGVAAAGEAAGSSGAVDGQEGLVVELTKLTTEYDITVDVSVAQHRSLSDVLSERTEGVEREGAEPIDDLAPESVAPGDEFTPESVAPGDEFTPESVAPGDEFTPEGVAPGDEFTPEGVEHEGAEPVEEFADGLDGGERGIVSPEFTDEGRDAMPEDRVLSEDFGAGYEGAAPGDELTPEGAAPGNEFTPEGAAPGDEFRESPETIEPQDDWQVGSGNLTPEDGLADGIEREGALPGDEFTSEDLEREGVMPGDEFTSEDLEREGVMPGDEFTEGM